MLGPMPPNLRLRCCRALRSSHCCEGLGEDLMEEEGIGPHPEEHLGVTEGGHGQESMLTESECVEESGAPKVTGQEGLRMPGWWGAIDTSVAAPL